MKINLNKKEDALYVVEVGKTYLTDDKLVYIVNRNRVIYYNKKQVVIKKHRGEIELKNVSNTLYLTYGSVITYDCFVCNFESYKYAIQKESKLYFSCVLVPKNKYEKFKSLIQDMGKVDEEVKFLNVLKRAVYAVRENYKLVKNNTERASFHKENAEKYSIALKISEKEALKIVEEIKLYFGEDKIPAKIAQYMKENTISLFETE